MNKTCNCSWHAPIARYYFKDEQPDTKELDLNKFLTCTSDSCENFYFLFLTNISMR